MIVKIIGNLSIFLGGFTLIMLSAIFIFYAAKNPEDKDLNPSGFYLGFGILVNTIVMILYFSYIISKGR